MGGARGAALIGALASALLAAGCATPIEIPGAPDKADPSYHYADGGTRGTGDAGVAADLGLEPSPDMGAYDRGDNGLGDGSLGDATADVGATEASTADSGHDATRDGDTPGDATLPDDGAGGDDAPGGDDV